MSELEADALSVRSRTQAHYDKYPFRFDQRVIVDEKMANRLMGAAILELPFADAADAADATNRATGGATIFDVGCGACRVAHMVQSAGRGRATSVDISLRTLRDAKTHNSSPVLNADNMHLPIQSGTADLVISNGVIMVTPDARASFGELARITKPGGTLVVSVYDRRSWYYPVYRFGGPVVRWLRDVIGDVGLRWTVFPFFHIATLALLAIVIRKPVWVPIEISWNLFHDQFTTPHCSFHTVEEVLSWGESCGLDCEENRSEAANQLISFRFRKGAAAVESRSD